MAIFGNKKKVGLVHKHRARTTVSPEGVAHEIIRAPWLSEKALIFTEKGVYVFEVSARATKTEIAGAIKEIYNVEPHSIRVINVPGKRKTMRTKRGEGQRSARRKAYVRLNAGDSIQLS